MKASAVLLAGGSGSRLQDPSGKKKQYLTLGGKPLICWSLEVLQRSSLIEDIILVVPAGDEDYVREEILSAGTEDAKADPDAVLSAGTDRDLRFGKVKKIVAGGRERYHSVYEGLKALRVLHAADAERIVYIHDGARPFVTEEELQRLAEDVQETGACVLAVPAKDTIKRAGANRMVIESLKREELWQMQTPQVFRLTLVLEAHRRLTENEAGKDAGESACDAAGGTGAHITDDAMVVSLAFPEQRILLTEGAYRNLKVTTPEDLVIAEALASGMKTSR